MQSRAQLFSLLTLIALGSFQSSRCLAIDNPDAPDLVGMFEARCVQYESKIRTATDTARITAAYSSYMSFLDQELNKAYSGVLQRVPGDARDLLVTSERQWIQYRDAENAFIVANWTTQKFGTSSAISRGDYRAAILKQRVITLLEYLKNY